MKKMQESGKDKEEIEAFKKGAPAALKKLTSNHSNYDFYIGESAEASGEGDYMYVVVDVSDPSSRNCLRITDH